MIAAIMARIGASISEPISQSKRNSFQTSLNAVKSKLVSDSPLRIKYPSQMQRNGTSGGAYKFCMAIAIILFRCSRVAT